MHEGTSIFIGIESKQILIYQSWSNVTRYSCLIWILHICKYWSDVSVGDIGFGFHLIQDSVVVEHVSRPKKFHYEAQCNGWPKFGVVDRLIIKTQNKKTTSNWYPLLALLTNSIIFHFPQLCNSWFFPGSEARRYGGSPRQRIPLLHSHTVAHRPQMLPAPP